VLLKVFAAEYLHDAMPLHALLKERRKLPDGVLPPLAELPQPLAEARYG
jgi:hypothetical protein